MHVLIADDKAEVRAALRMLLKHQLREQDVGEAADAVGLVTHLTYTPTDVLLLDWGLAAETPAMRVVELHARFSALKVIVISGYTGARQTALDAGAAAFVSKSDPPDVLIAALRQVFDRHD